MNGVLDAAVEVDQLLQQTGLPYCLIGGIALQRWGQPRTTLDVDVTVMTQFGREESAIQQLVSVFRARIADAVEFARQSRVVLVQTTNGVGVDIALGALPFESRMMQRSSIWQVDDTRSLRTCSAEDLIVQKVFAGRDQDWVDVRRVIETRRGALDRALIRQELQPLLELNEDHAAAGRLEDLFVNC